MSTPTETEIALTFYREYNKLKNEGRDYKSRCIYSELHTEQFIESYEPYKED